MTHYSLRNKKFDVQLSIFYFYLKLLGVVALFSCSANQSSVFVYVTQALKAGLPLFSGMKQMGLWGCLNLFSTKNLAVTPIFCG